MRSPGKEQEADLARRLLAGAPEAFDAFVEYFRRKIYQYTWLMCGQREDAEEVSQETLLKVFERIQELRDPENVKAWVFQIARNECLMKRRKSIFAPERELSLDKLVPAKNMDGGKVRIEIADWSALPEDLAHRSEMKDLLERAIRELPEANRSVLLLRDVEELSTADTARILGLGEDVVRTRLHRARLAVRATLDAFLRGEHATAPT